MQCQLCLERGLERDLCIPCELTIFHTRQIIQDYATGSVSPEMKLFTPEISFTFERDYRRARRYFKVAQELITKSIFEYPNAPIPMNELKELSKRKQSEIKLIMRLLTRARVARLAGSLVYLEEISQKIAQLIPGGVDLSSEEYQNSVEEMKGILCVVLAESLMDIWREGDKQYGRPKKYLLYMRGLSKQLLDVTKHISRSVDIVDFLNITYLLQWEGEKLTKAPRSQLQMSSEQRLKIFREDVLALGGGRSKIFERFFAEPGGHFSAAFKESVIRHLERMRERWRERPRER